MKEQLYVINNPPDISNLKIKLLLKRGFEEESHFEIFDSFFRNKGETACPVMVLTKKEVVLLESFGSTVEEYIEKCICNHCEDCRKRRIKELTESLSVKDRIDLDTILAMKVLFDDALDKMSPSVQEVYYEQQVPKIFKGPYA